jgi:ABC-2 type transport system permease protein
LWLSTPLPIIYWAWLSLYLGSGVASGVFARERELHTLETLLATRLSDHAILIGKMVASIIYSWGIVVIANVLSGMVLNVTQWQGQLVSFTPAVWLGGLLISLLTALLIASLGVLVSLNATTALQAQTTLSWATLALLLPLISLRFLPDIQVSLKENLLNSNEWRLVAVTALALLGIDAVMVAMVAARYRRDNLLFG